MMVRGGKQPGGGGEAAGDRGGHTVRVEKLGVRTVDNQCHMKVPEADALVKDVARMENEPLMWFSNDATRAYQKQHGQDIHQKIIDVSLRLAEMDATGVDVPAIPTAPHHHCHWAQPVQLDRASGRDRVVKAV